MARNLKYEHVFFDLDRTLWDTDKNAADTLRYLVVKYKLNERGIENVDEFVNEFNILNEHFWTLYGQDKISKDQLRLQRFVDILKKYNIKDYTLCHNLSNDFTAITPKRSGLIDGAKDMLDYLKHKYHLHILTNGFNEIQKIKLRHSGIRNYFKKMITAEDAEAKKPHKDFFTYALSKTGASKSNCIMVGDNVEIDIVGAINSNISSIFYNPLKVEHNYTPDHEIKHLLELKKIL